MTTTNCCAAEFSGLKTSHCTACHQTFATVTAFDKHRSGSHATDTRQCLEPSSVGLVKSSRAYACWGYPAAREEIGA
jgi:hypothetical protein